MINHVEGKLFRLTPTQAVVDCGGVGYAVNISLHTFSKIKDAQRVLLYTHLSIREDAHVLYGFFDEDEREIFLHLISVSGVGAATARMIISSLTPAEIEQSILAGDVSTFKRVKGIGAKSAERIIIDLRDKVGKGKEIQIPIGGISGSSGMKQEANLALQALGFAKPAIEKAIAKVDMSNESNTSVETIIKEALKYL